MVSYRLTLQAKADLKRIYRYGVLKFGVNRADTYYETLHQRFSKLAENPFQYQAVDNIRPGYRRCPCGADTIYYRVYGDCVEIARILGRQDSGQNL